MTDGSELREILSLIDLQLGLFEAYCEHPGMVGHLKAARTQMEAVVALSRVTLPDRVRARALITRS